MKTLVTVFAILFLIVDIGAILFYIFAAIYMTISDWIIDTRAGRVMKIPNNHICRAIGCTMVSAKCPGDPQCKILRKLRGGAA